MSDHETFIRAIAAQPENETLRLSYANWLEERGDVRAEFIRLHTRLAKQPEDHRFFNLLQREQTIRRHINPSWLKSLGYDEAYPRLFRLHEGLWLEDWQAMLRWGMNYREAATVGFCRRGGDNECRTLMWWSAGIWRGMRATITAGFREKIAGETGGLTDLLLMVDQHTAPKKWTKKMIGGCRGIDSANFAQYLAQVYEPTAVQKTGIDLLTQRFGHTAHHNQEPAESLRWEWSFAEIRLSSVSNRFMLLHLCVPNAPRI